MRVLIVNYELDDNSPVLVWQADVVRSLAKRCEQVVVLTQKLGAFEPPENVIVEPVPIRPYGVPQRIGGRWLMNPSVARLCREYRIQACFVHMASDWTYILGPLLKLMHIPILMWYAHGTVSNRLRLAHAFADRVVTSTPEGFRLPSGKVAVIGQGVNVKLFDIPKNLDRRRNHILYIGRVSRRKRIDQLVDVMKAVHQRVPQSPIKLKIVGPTLTSDDEVYRQEILARIESCDLQDRVELVGFVPQRELPAYYRQAFLHLNLSRTGSMDKTVLEALACGCAVLTNNEAFRGLLRNYPEFFLEKDASPQTIADSVVAHYQNLDACAPSTLRKLVVGSHDLESYTLKVYTHLTELAQAKV